MDNKAIEFRANSARCLQLSEETNNLTDKGHWVTMSGNWLRLLANHERELERYGAAYKNSADWL